MPAPHLDIASQIETIHRLERPALLQAWNKAYGAPPFKGARKPTLIRGLAYNAQCKEFGGLKPRTARKLLKSAKPKNAAVRASDLQGSTPRSPKIKLGSQIVREWNGRTHTVHVTDRGFVMSGVTYSSLSAAAKAITGSHWSGPRFFGVSG